MAAAHQMIEVQECDKVPFSFAEIFSDLIIFPDDFISAFDSFFFAEQEPEKRLISRAFKPLMCLLLRLRLRSLYRPETNNSGFTTDRRHRVSLATCSSLDSSFASLALIGATSFAGGRMSPSIFRRRAHVAVGRCQSPFTSGSGSWASLADCASAAQTSLTLVLPSRDQQFRLHYRSPSSGLSGNV